MSDEIIFCIDMQNNYNTCPGNSELVAKLSSFCQAALEQGIPVWMIYLDFDRLNGDLILDGKEPSEQLRVSYQKALTVQLEGHDPVIVIKDACNAFSNPNLIAALHVHGVKKIYMTGQYAQDCVAATALGASLNGFETSVVLDMVAPTTIEAAQQKQWLYAKMMAEVKLPPHDYAPNSRAYARWIHEQTKSPDGMRWYEKNMKVLRQHLLNNIKMRDANSILRRFDKAAAILQMRINGAPLYQAYERIGLTCSADILANAARPVLMPATAAVPLVRRQVA